MPNTNEHAQFAKSPLSLYKQAQEKYQCLMNNINAIE